ncbi:MAG: Dam family site-specific DNA-(adenine-N6)-methyltransferase [Actinobacteria bacterium]|nr:Dam family site-specific DNA-(adenine-N6)-methyltransferase [Actinomycetota bacterium]
MTKTRPFLRWVGGKARLVSRLSPSVPALGDDFTYYEPFLGAGSMFFAVKPKRSVLGDENLDLVQCYARVKARPDLVWRHLRALMPCQGRDEYYAFRTEFNRSSDSFRRAALFIYLNKTCFNGIWRVSRAGDFNVPYGAKAKPGFPKRAELFECSNALAPARLNQGDFESTVAGARQGDLVYFDPPYLPMSATAFFRHYTAHRFTTGDHERVALVAAQLALDGVNVMVTEGDSELVRKWYRDFVIREVDVRRSVSCGSERHDARELIITSYATEPSALPSI